MVFHPILKVIIFIIAVIVLGVVIFLWTQVARASVGNLQIYQGSVEVIRSGRSQSGSTGELIHLGDTLKIAADSRVAIVLKDSSVIRLEAGTEVEVAELEYQGEKIKQAIFKLKFGRLWSRVAPLEQNGSFEVETPTAVAAVAGTSYNTTYNEQITGVYVYRQRVSVALIKNRSNAKQITAGELLRMENSRLDQDFERGPQPVTIEYTDDWILFNQAEDDRICRDRPQTPGCEDYFEQPAATPTTKISPTSLPEVSTNQPLTSVPRSEKKSTVAGLKQSQPTAQIPKEEPVQLTETQSNAGVQNQPDNQPVALPTQVSETSDTTVSQAPPSTIAPVTPVQPTPAPSDTPPPTIDQPAPSPSPPPKILNSLVLAADKTTLNTDERTSLKVTAHYSDQSTTDVTSQSKFTITQGSGTIINAVFYSGQAGVVKISATFESLTTQELAIEIKRVRQLIDLRLSYKIVDQDKRTAQFTAIAVYSDKIEKDVTSETPWGIRRIPGQEPSGSQIDKNGFYQAGRALSDTITAEYQGVKKEIVISFSFESPLR